VRVNGNASVPFATRCAPQTGRVSEFRDPQYGPPLVPGPPPGYGPPVYGPPAYGSPAYGPPGYPPPYGTGYGAQAPWAPPTATWPYGPGRPPLATAAAVLGHVTAGLTILFSLIFLVSLATGEGDPAQGVLVLGLPCAAGLIVGGVRLTGRRSAGLLFAAAAASVGLLLASLIAGIGWLTSGDLAFQVVFVVVALPLPLLTAIFARARSVTGWVAAHGS